jgi:hypothetical protein
VESPSQTPVLDVSVSASFPAAEIFGVKLVNGRPTQALLSYSNNEPAPVTVNFIGGSLWTADLDSQGNPRILRNLTTTRYNLEIPAGGKESLSYSFATELHPQDLRLNLATVLSNGAGKFFTVQVYNETVSIVEQDTSIFDPQMWVEPPFLPWFRDTNVPSSASFSTSSSLQAFLARAILSIVLG